MFYYWKNDRKILGLCGAVKPGEKKNQQINQAINDKHVCRAALALSGSAKYMANNQKLRRNTEEIVHHPTSVFKY